MAGMMPIKRQIVFCSNMFDPTQKEFSEVDGSLSYREIYDSLTVYPLDYAVIIDGDKKVEISDFDNIPESDTLYIKLFPSGGGGQDFWSNGPLQMAAGFALATIGVALTVASVGTLSWVGIGLISMGSGMFLTGVSTAFGSNMDSSGSASFNSPKENPSLKGGRNQVRQGGRVGILLGKHLINPDIAALSYISISGSDQYLHMMFCAGFNNIQIDTDTYKIGDTKLISANYDFTLNVSQSGESLEVYPERKIASSISGLLESGVPSTKTTPTNTRAIEVYITFPQGLIKYNKDGDKKTATVVILIEYCNTGTGLWKTLFYSAITKKTTETDRNVITKTLDNATVSGEDYCSTRQYDIRVTRITADTDDSKIIDKVYLDSIQSITGAFDGTTVNTAPVIASAAADLTLMALRLKATQTVSGQIESFNFIGQSIVNIYSGSGTGASQWTTGAASSNPAALFLYVIQNARINKKPATNNQVNWSSFESWYLFCEDKGIECNAFIVNDIVLEELLNQIAISGRASWGLVDGKFNIIADKSQSVSVQLFTPRNSWGFSATKVFPEQPTGLRMKFVDAASGYVESERVVFYDDDNPDDEKIDDCSLWGCTSADEAWMHGKYRLACSYLRPEVFTFNADVEHIICTRWDRISINHDVPLLGLGAGKIKTVYFNSGAAIGIESDERMLFEPSKVYCITVRAQSGSTRTVTLINPAITYNVETDDLYFQTPVAVGTFSFNEDDLFAFGLSGFEKMELIVTDIEPADDLSAKITCIPYVEELYTWDGGTPPVYNSMISIPGDINNAVIIGIPIDPSLTVVENTNQIEATNNYSTALTCAQDTIQRIDSDDFDAVYPYASQDGTLYYLNLTHNGIYERGTSGTDEGSAIVSHVGYMFCDDYYVRSENGFIYDLSGNIIIDYPAWCPQLTDLNQILHIRLSDNGIYSYDIDTEEITRIGTFSLLNLWMQYIADNKVLIWDDGTINGTGVDGFILIDINTGLLNSTLVSNVGEVQSFQMLDEDTLLYLDANMNLRRYEFLTSENLLFFPNVVQFDSLDGNLYFISLNGSNLYKQFKSSENSIIDLKPYVRASSVVITITGSCVIDENVITGLSDYDIYLVETGNVIKTVNFPIGTTILSIDTVNNQIMLNKKATATASLFTIEITTSRIMQDARYSIAAKTVTNNQVADEFVFGKTVYNGFTGSLVASFGEDIGACYLVICRESSSGLNANVKVAIVRIISSGGNLVQDVVVLSSTSSKFSYGAGSGNGTITFSNTDSSLDPVISYSRMQ